MDYAAIEKITESVKRENSFVEAIKAEVAKVIIGQERLIERIIITFISGGHILLEGLPGLAKTLTVRAFSRAIDTDFKRIQFTPDLLPADLIGTRIYNPKELDFFTKKGPIFTNILLSDEINRAPAKVQSALLQAMEEKQVTIGDETHALGHPFMVMATENPIEQEGTYPLPEAQLDRFFMKVLVDYPSFREELEILNRFKEIDVSVINKVITPAKISEKAKLVDSIYIDEKLIEYIVTLVTETRQPSRRELKKYIEFGASPRASIAIMKASRCVAFMRGRGFVTPDDIKEIGADVLRHRIILTYEAEADGKGPDDVIRFLFDSVEVP
ncbi:MAG TPA: MoxR family ATPase [Spirochaetota bacterium]|nr:MoxR family ATPase [Spirochaetota bacterium]HPR49247.1 MoxR family ATPase [Spirochaetota bacterium]